MKSADHIHANTYDGGLNFKPSPDSFDTLHTETAASVGIAGISMLKREGSNIYYTIRDYSGHNQLSIREGIRRKQRSSRKVFQGTFLSSALSRASGIPSRIPSGSSTCTLNSKCVYHVDIS